MDNLATEMLKELKSNAKRWFIAFIVALVLWFITIGLFVWYINQPIEETTETTEYTQDANTGDNSSITQSIGE
jgi:Sec-independent protein secretion pathway component TatC